MTEMTELQVTARFRIHEGQFDEFETLAEQCIQIVREKDAGGTLQYDWFYNEAHDECVVRERYRDSDAVLEHMANLGDTVGALLDVCDFSAEICGTPSAELSEAIADFDVQVYSAYQSI